LARGWMWRVAASRYLRAGHGAGGLGLRAVAGAAGDGVALGARAAGAAVAEGAGGGGAAVRRAVGGLRAVGTREAGADLAPVDVRVRQTRHLLFLMLVRYLAVGVVASPFVIWTGAYTYAYLFRVNICASRVQDGHPGFLDGPGAASSLGGLLIDHLGRASRSATTLFGKENEVQAIRAFVDGVPNRIGFVVGCNDSGKTAVMREVIAGKGAPKARHTVHVDLASSPVTNVGAFVDLITSQLGVTYLGLRTLLTDASPFAGGEILVMKERQTVSDLKESLDVVTAALEEVARKPGAAKRPPPLLYFDGIGFNLEDWQGTRDGWEAVQMLVHWAMYVTKERELAHVVFGTTPSFVTRVLFTFKDIHSTVKLFDILDLPSADARKYLDTQLERVGLGAFDVVSERQREEILKVVGGRVNDLNHAVEEILVLNERRTQKPPHPPVEASAGEGEGARDEPYAASNHAHRHGPVMAALRNVTRHSRARVLDGLTTHASLQSTRRVARGKSAGEEEEEEEDPYLDPLKRKYSSLTALEGGDERRDEEARQWTPLQLWQTMKVILSARGHAVCMHELRDSVFEGDMRPLQALLDAEILSCRQTSPDRDEKREAAMWSQWARRRFGGQSGDAEGDDAARGTYDSHVEQQLHVRSLWVLPYSTLMKTVLSELLADPWLRERMSALEVARAKTERAEKHARRRALLRLEHAEIDHLKDDLLKTEAVLARGGLDDATLGGASARHTDDMRRQILAKERNYLQRLEALDLESARDAGVD